MRAAISLVAVVCLMAAVPVRAQQAEDASAPTKRCSPDEYRHHLEELRAVVAACSAQRTAVACDPAQVGPDDEVVTPEGLRAVHYGWLRGTLKDAVGGKDAAGSASASDKGAVGGAQSIEPVAVRLNAAVERLAVDAQTGPGAVASIDGVSAGMSVDAVRGNLNAVLAQREFRRIQQQPNLLQQAAIAVLEWIVEHLSKVAAFGGRNPWIARLLEATAITVPCVLLLWWGMVRMRRQAALPPPAEPVAPSAPSAREWQRWMQEAEAFAQQQRWREAVHHVYWAAISRMEAHGLWPADRARTPREYLALLRAGHSLQADLRGLTRSFERIWYGHRPAEEQQYREARAWMDRLVPR